MKIFATFLFQMFSAGFVMFIITIIPFGLLLAIKGLELTVSFIQAYILTFLSCSYIKDSID